MVTHFNFDYTSYVEISKTGFDVAENDGVTGSANRKKMVFINNKLLAFTERLTGIRVPVNALLL